MDVKNKVVLMTGGLGAICIEVAKHFLKAEVKGIALLDVNISNQVSILNDFNKEFGEGKVLIIKTDVTKDEDVKNAFEFTVKAYKNLDIVVNGAGIISKNWEKEIEVNYKGTYRVLNLAMKTYLPKYKSGADAVIVNIASIAGIDSFPVVINYGATKAAIVSLHRSYSFPYFYDKYKVKFLAICPGLTDTPILTNFGQDELAPQLFEQMANAMQQTEDLAPLFVKAVQSFNNGDIVVIEENKMYTLKTHDRQESCK